MMGDIYIHRYDRHDSYTSTFTVTVNISIHRYDRHDSYTSTSP